jgi:hypothetical protein
MSAQLEISVKLERSLQNPALLVNSIHSQEEKLLLTVSIVLLGHSAELSDSKSRLILVTQATIALQDLLPQPKQSLK